MRTLSTALLIALLLPAAAHGQAWPGRVLVSVNGGVQAPARTLTDEFTYEHRYTAGIPGEEASLRSTLEIPSGALFDGGVAVRLYRNLGAGIAISGRSGTSDIEIAARLPHPLFAQRHREVEGTVPSRHSETAVHLQAVYVIVPARRVLIALSGGPSRITAERKLVRSVSASESYPYDSAIFVGADIQAEKPTGWGFNAGVDVSWMFSRNFGLGALVRYAGASLRLRPEGREAVDVEVGGLQAGGGARIAF